MIDVITPNWPAPANIQAFTTTRLGGFSLAPFDTFNLALHVGDSKTDVLQNREVLTRKKNLPHAPLWLEQNHTSIAVSADIPYEAYPEGDASYSFLPDRVCAVMTADCLPILICDIQGTQVAAIHAGWRGLVAGIIPATLDKLKGKPKDLMAWFGPAIGPEAYEVKDDVRDAFLQNKSGKPEHFKPTSSDSYLLNVYAIAQYQLNNLGLTHVFGGEYCTYTDAERFFSYRRSGNTGRMASVIWLKNT
jgi:YfiH family protein